MPEALRWEIQGLERSRGWGKVSKGRFQQDELGQLK